MPHQAVSIQNLIILPHIKININDEWSYEFQILNNDGVAIEVDEQQYDKFRIYPNGSIRGTMETDYYVYDEVDINESNIITTYVDTKRLYKTLHEVCESLFEDHTENAISQFEDDEWEF